MAKKRIITVNVGIPGADDLDCELHSDRSLLDADIVLFRPGIPIEAMDYSQTYAGKPLLTEYWSSRLSEAFSHWRSELQVAVKQGKTVIVYLSKPTDVFVHTGRTDYSGTGRNARRTNIVAPFSSYSAIPFTFDSMVPKSGEKIRPASDLRHLAPYWTSIGAQSHFEVHVEGKFSRVFLTTHTGDRVVGAEVANVGHLMFLPPVAFSPDEFLEDRVVEGSEEVELVWTDRAIAFGNQWIQAVLALDSAANASRELTPAPEWSHSDAFTLPVEAQMRVRVGTIAAELERLTIEKATANAQLSDAGRMRALLWGTGAELEKSILLALQCLGFAAEKVEDGDARFDSVFSSPEGRFLGEAEGRDAKAISVDKLSQLERNVSEDFARDGVAEHAKPVLFGNAYRLKPLEERGDYFSEKCVTGAKRAGAALVRTPDLFFAARAILRGADEDYKLQCREAIAAASGEIVVFPVPADGLTAGV